MTQKRKATHKRQGIEPRHAYLHHLEQLSVHLAAARQAHEELDPTERLYPDYRMLQSIGKRIATLYRRAGGNPDATT